MSAPVPFSEHFPVSSVEPLAGGHYPRQEEPSMKRFAVLLSLLAVLSLILATGNYESNASLRIGVLLADGGGPPPPPPHPIIQPLPVPSSAHLGSNASLHSGVLLADGGGTPPPPPHPIIQPLPVPPSAHVGSIA